MNTLVLSSVAILTLYWRIAEALNVGARNRIHYGMGIITKDGAVHTIGSFNTSLPPPEVEEKLKSGVVDLVSSSEAFCALKDDGSVVAWGERRAGGVIDTDIMHSLRHGVVNLYSLHSGFIAIKNDTSAIVWGEDPDGNRILAQDSDGLIDVKKAFTTHGAVAFLKYDGTVLVTGDKNFGAYIPWYKSRQLRNIRTISMTWSAFAAITHDGEVITWGGNFDKESTEKAYNCITCGADSSKVADKLHNIQQVFASQGAFCALNLKGEAICWGEEMFGGNPMNGTNEWNKRTAADLSNIIMIYSNDQTFCALKKDRTAI